ncbi:glycosyltransferase family 1 protein [Microvirga vignae]|nr:glycosyltransferase family 1 protein [Microvirga vignae]
MLRVLIVPELYETGAPTACAYWRLILPFTDRLITSAINVRFVPLAQLSAVRGDIVVMQRTSARTVAELERLRDYCERTGTKLVYDIDDDLLALGDDHPEKHAYAGLVEVVRGMLAAADQVWVSTEVLAERYRPLACEVVVVPNRLDPRIWRAHPIVPRSGGPVRFVYAGTPSHQADYEELIAPGFRRLRNEFGADVELYLIGLRRVSHTTGTVELPVPDGAAGSYPLFATWLQSMNDLDVGLAPLADTSFNRAKSNIKWMEYSGVGLASILTDIEAYRTANGQDLPALYVKPTINAFYEAMRRLTKDRDEVLRLRKAAHEIIASALGDEGGRAHRRMLLDSL